MIEDLRQSLHRQFGFSDFRPGQVEAITSLCQGEHTLAVMPTGSGKSLIYQFSALQHTGLTLVLSPLIALMKDQVDGLARHGIPATCIHSGISSAEQAQRLRAMAAGSFRLVYVAPERLRSSAFQQVLRGLTVDLLAVDEAHCISQWGHDFRPDYLRIAEARAAMGDPLTVALTATATPQVQDDIVRLLGLPGARRIVTGFNRPNLFLTVRYTVDLPAKLRALQASLTALQGGAALVYTGTRRETEEVADFIRSVVHLPAEPYHAGMEAEVRARIQDDFLSGALPVVVATNAFGMGVDRSDVRLVLHFSLPGTLEAYYQEAGRAGRDGRPAEAVLLYAPQDRALQEWFIENSTPDVGELRRLYDILATAGPDPSWWSNEDLSLNTELPEVKVRVGLAQLERAGALERLGDEGFGMLLQRERWDEKDVRATIAPELERRRFRQKQLNEMVAYAETNECRRRLLLNHFGDKSPAEADKCCDNCLVRAQPAPQAGDVESLSQAERVALIILDTLRRLHREVGRGKLAQVLKGSKAKEIQEFGYDKNVYYGRLVDFTLDEIEGFIDQLIVQGYVKAVGGEYPVLRATPLGQSALKARAAIPLTLPERAAKKAAQKKASRERAAERGEATGRAVGATVDETAQLFSRGLKPAQIATERGLSERTIYGHLAQLIEEGSVPLDAVVVDAVAEQVRAAIARVGSTEKLNPLKSQLPPHISYEEIRCVIAADKWARSDVAAFLSRPHPTALSGPWKSGWSLGFHSRFAGSDWSRSSVGELTYRLKYQGDAEALPPLLDQAVALCREHPELGQVDALVPVPPSVQHDLDPVSALADGLAARLNRPVCRFLVKLRRTAPQKEMRTLAQKRANVAGAFSVKGDVRGKRVLVLDDLFDSGATLEEVYRVLQRAGAASIHVLTLTRTIHAEG